jgi:hypothetical protein
MGGKGHLGGVRVCVLGGGGGGGGMRTGTFRRISPPAPQKKVFLLFQDFAFKEY